MNRWDAALNSSVILELGLSILGIIYIGYTLYTGTMIPERGYIPGMGSASTSMPTSLISSLIGVGIVLFARGIFLVQLSRALNGSRDLFPEWGIPKDQQKSP